MQFLPAEWAQYGVDANGDGFKDPYNPADAIFTAARYLKAAGGDTNIRARGLLLQPLAGVRGIGDAARAVARRHPVRAARGGHRADRSPLPGARALALQRWLRDRARERRLVRRHAEDARRDDDLLPAGRAGDRRAGRRNRRARRNPLAGALRDPARRLRQHLHLRRARQRGDALPGARAARAHRGQHADRRVERARANPPRAVRPARARSPARRCPKAPPSPRWRWARRPAWKRPRHPRRRRRPPAPAAALQAGERPRGSSARAPTRSICTR